jgi:hypothetical protein
LGRHLIASRLRKRTKSAGIKLPWPVIWSVTSASACPGPSTSCSCFVKVIIPATGRASAALASVRKIAAELLNTACEVAEDRPCERKESTSRRWGPPRLDLVYPRSNPARACGKIEAKTVDQFHILGKITAKIPGRATRTERELNVD